MDQSPSARLDFLKTCLETDPNNLHLIEDTIGAAVAAKQLLVAAELLEHRATLAPLSPELLNLSGQIALETNQLAKAIAIFQSLSLQDPENLVFRLNQAWALYYDHQLESASALLNDEIVTGFASGSLLKSRLLHLESRFEEALEVASQGLERHPNDRNLLGISSVLAMDLDDQDLAYSTAILAGDNCEALTTLAILEIRDGHIKAASEKLAKVAEREPFSARAALGQGMVSMLENNLPEAIKHLKRGAQLFKTHAGSWVALGWAELLAGNQSEAEVVFRKALELDRTFAETHGSIAVIEALKGNSEASQHAALTARRLDPQSFAAMLANVLVHASRGEKEMADHIFKQALSTPVDTEGRTLTSLIANMTDLFPKNTLKFNLYQN
ncbi:tetratricopeptide repeat protein [Candidatus Phycosocius spiralis]|nr:tetratricopeptide repeat protein [Candidatus Phycosocius spiralis]